MSYNAAGELVSHVDFLSRTSIHQYDLRGRKTRTTHGDGRVTTMTYDTASQQTTLSEDGQTWSYQYDRRGRVTQITQPNGVVGYQYDAAGNRTRVTSPNLVVDYGFDVLNRLATVRSGTPAALPTNATPATSYVYDVDGTLQRTNHANGTRVEYGYNQRDFVLNVVHRAANDDVLLGLNYAVDKTGLRNAITETVGGQITRSTAYTYDQNKRLLSETMTPSTGAARVTSWAYDDVGNRQSQTIDGSGLTYTYDANDRLLSESDGTTHSYDNMGNLLRTQKASDIQRYSWDSSNRLIEHTAASGDRTGFAYDPNGTRTDKISKVGATDSSRTRFVIDYVQPYAQVIEEAEGPATGSTFALTQSYVHGHDLISSQRGSTTAYFHTDALGSTRLLTDATGIATDRYAYTAYGEADESGSSGTTENKYRYTGEQFDPELGQYYLRARYMDPARGRFMGMDPFGGRMTDPATLHKMTYVHNSPVDSVDPSGLLQGPFSPAPVILGTTFAISTAAKLKAVAVVAAVVLVTMATNEVRQRRRNRDMPTIWFGSDVLGARNHVESAIEHGMPSVLTYINPGHPDRWYRNKPECRDLVGGTTGLDCDEYPFKSAAEGGPVNYSAGRVSLKPVHSLQNQLAGSWLGAFISECGVIPFHPTKSKYKVGTTDEVTDWDCGVGQ